MQNLLKFFASVIHHRYEKECLKCQIYVIFYEFSFQQLKF